MGFEPVTTLVWVFCAESNCGIRTRDPMQLCDGVSFTLCHRCISRHEDGEALSSVHSTALAAGKLIAKELRRSRSAAGALGSVSVFKPAGGELRLRATIEHAGSLAV